jgi:hypothetical protein
MKKLIFASLLVFASHFTQAQVFSFGIKGGVNTQIDKPKDIVVGSGGTPFNLGVENLEFGTQFGAYFRFGKKVFIQPELLFNSNHTDYKVGTFNVVQTIKKEKYQYLDMPVMVGFKLGPVRIQGGPVDHLFLHSTSELTDIDGYKSKFKQMAWGYQTGLSIGLGRFAIDARYEGNFSKEGDHITFFGDQYSFSTTPSRIILALSIALKK